MNIELMNDLHLMLGRINGLHAVVLNIARTLPPSQATEAAKALRSASEAIQADALATPTSDLQINEMARVMDEAARVLDAAAKTQ